MTWGLTTVSDGPRARAEQPVPRAQSGRTGRIGAAAGRLVVLVGALTVLALGSSPAGAARLAQQEGGADAPATETSEVDPFDKLASCVGAQGRLLVVLLADESASLRTTDPEDQRVAAAQAALTSIDRLRGSGDSAVDIDVLVSTFSYDFTPVGDWVDLDDDTRAEVEAQIDGLAERDASMDTDFHNALEGARQALAERATETTADDGTGVCKTVLMFTDGNFTLGARETAQQQEDFGTSKVYAPDIELTDESVVQEVTQAGVAALCHPGGVADRFRNDRITLVSVALGDGADLLQAITQGSSEEGRECGDPETDTPGAYLLAGDTVDLLRTFDLAASRIAGGALAADPLRAAPCAEAGCDDASVTFGVSPNLRRVHVFGAVPDSDTKLVLQPPEGDALEIEAGDDPSGEVAGVPISGSWIASDAVTFDLDVPADGTGSGEWTVSLVGESDQAGVLQVVVFSDVVAALGPASSLELGGEGEIVALLQTRAGDEPPTELSDIVLVATVTDPITGSADEVLMGPNEDVYRASYAVGEAVTAAAVRVSFRLEAVTAEGARVTSVSPDFDLAVARPAGYPQVSPPRVELSSIVGEGTARGQVTIEPPAEGAGCVWVEDLVVGEAPTESGLITLEVADVARTAAGCTEVSEVLTIPIDVTSENRATGTFTGHIRMVLSQADGEAPIPTDVVVSFEMARGVDQTKRLVLAAFLMAGGLLLPLLLLTLINLLTTRFQDLEQVRAAKVPVIVTGQGQVYRADGEAHGLYIPPRDFEDLSGHGGGKHFTWGGLEFKATTPLNPFSEPHATVAPEGGVADVARDARKTDLALGLAGSWLFLLDQDATRAASRSDHIHGQLVAFVAAGGELAQTTRLIADVETRLPSTARSLARVANLKSGGVT